MKDSTEIYDFGLRLKDLRKTAGYSQQEVANRLGLDVSTIKRYESNTLLPPVDKLEVMATMYHASLDYIRNLTDRKSFFLDDFSPTQQEAIMTFIEKLKTDFLEIK